MLVDPWIDWFRERGGKKYLGYVVCQGEDGRWWMRDLTEPLFRRSIGTSATLADAKRAAEILRGLVKPVR